MVARALVGALLALALSACGTADANLLGGRQKCWDPSDKRIASLMKGTFDLAATPAELDTPEGETLELRFATFSVQRNDTGALTLVDAGGSQVARNGELVSVFGGLASDGSMLVCSVEEHH